MHFKSLVEYISNSKFFVDWKNRPKAPSAVEVTAQTKLRLEQLEIAIGDGNHLSAPQIEKYATQLSSENEVVKENQEELGDIYQSLEEKLIFSYRSLIEGTMDHFVKGALDHPAIIAGISVFLLAITGFIHSGLFFSRFEISPAAYIENLQDFISLAFSNGLAPVVFIFSLVGGLAYNVHTTVQHIYPKLAGPEVSVMHLRGSASGVQVSRVLFTTMVSLILFFVFLFGDMFLLYKRADLTKIQLGSQQAVCGRIIGSTTSYIFFSSAKSEDACESDPSDNTTSRFSLEAGYPSLDTWWSEVFGKKNAMVLPKALVSCVGRLCRVPSVTPTEDRLPIIEDDTGVPGGNSEGDKDDDRETVAGGLAAFTKVASLFYQIGLGKSNGAGHNYQSFAKNILGCTTVLGSEYFVSPNFNDGMPTDSQTKQPTGSWDRVLMKPEPVKKHRHDFGTWLGKIKASNPIVLHVAGFANPAADSTYNLLLSERRAIWYSKSIIKPFLKTLAIEPAIDGKANYSDLEYLEIGFGETIALRRTDSQRTRASNLDNRKYVAVIACEKQ